MDFPVRDGAQPKFGGVSDGFVVRIDATGSELLGGTYLGGAGSDSISGLALDPLGKVYVTGTTTAVEGIPSGPVIQRFASTGDFPIRNAVQPKWTALLESAFVTQFGADLTEIAYSTYLSGSGIDSGSDMAVDSVGNAYITGRTQSRDFPLASPLQRELGGGSGRVCDKAQPWWCLSRFLHVSRCSHRG